MSLSKVWDGEGGWKPDVLQSMGLAKELDTTSDPGNNNIYLQEPMWHSIKARAQPTPEARAVKFLGWLPTGLSKHV